MLLAQSLKVWEIPASQPENCCTIGSEARMTPSIPWKPDVIAAPKLVMMPGTSRFICTTNLRKSSLANTLPIWMAIVPSAPATFRSAGASPAAPR